MKRKNHEVKRTGLSLPKELFEKLEEKRGMVSRSAYIREVLKAWWEEGHTLDDLKESDNSG